MKQTPNDAPNSASMGITSVAGLLQIMATDTYEGNQILSNIKKTFDNFSTFVFGSVNALLFKQTFTNVLQSKTNSLLVSINYFIFSINAKLDKILGLNTGVTKSIGSSSSEVSSLGILNKISDNVQVLKDIIFEHFKLVPTLSVEVKDSKAKDLLYGSINKFANVATNILSSNGLTENINQINLSIKLAIDQSNVLLQNIADVLTDIFVYLPQLSEQSEKEKAKSRKNEFIGLAKSLGSFRKELTDKFLEAFEKFTDLYERFVDNKNTKKLILVSVNLLAFSTTLRIVGFLVHSVKKAFMGLTLAIGLLSIMLLLPPFQMGILFLLGFLFTVTRILGGAKEGFKATMSIRRLGTALMLLIGAMWLMGKLKFGAIFKMLFFLAGLALVMKLFEKRNTGPVNITKNITKKFETKGLFGLAMGLAFLVLSIDIVSGVTWGGVWPLIVFIMALGGTIAILNKLNPGGVNPFSEMFQLGIGLALLVVVLSLVGDISFMSLMKLVAFIMAIGLAISTANYLMNRFGKGMPRAPLPGIKANFSLFGTSGILSFALGIAVLVLTIAATGDLNWAPAMFLLGFIVLLGIAIGSHSFFIKGSSKSGMFTFALGIAILVLTIDAIKDLDWAPAWKLLLFVAAIGLVTKFLKPKGSLELIGLSLAMGVLAISLWALSKVNITLEQIENIAIVVLGMAGIMIILSNMKMNLATGGLALLYIASISVLVALSLFILSKMTIDMVQILLFIGAILLITLTFIGLGFMIPEALPGATMALGMAGIVFLVALSLYMIEGLTFENVGAFMLAIGGLAVGLALLLPELLVGVVSAALLVVVGLGVLLFAGAMLAIMELEIDPKKIDGFTSGITSIMTAFNSFGVIEVAKAVLKAVALVPIIAVSLLAALTFSAIEKLDLSEGKIGAFGTFLAQFIQVTTTEISKSVQGLKDAEPGIKALSLLVNVGADLARLITDFSNMNYNEYGWKDGKLQIINVRKLTDTEIAQVGVNFGKLIQGLLVPLTVMSSDDEFWDFGGGVKVKNIFKDGFFGDNNSGVNRLAKIANAFKPLVEGIASLANLNMSQDPKMLENFKLSLSTSMSSITDAFDKLENWKNDKSSTSIDLITKLAKSLKEFDNFTSISDGMEKFLNNLADEDKWSKINKNLQGLNENFASIAKNINSIEIDKALALEKNLKLMTDKESSDNLSVVVANLKEMIGMITASQQQQTQVIASMFPQQTLLPEENKTETVNPIWSDIKELMKQIGDKIEGTNNKLSGKLKVTMVNANDPNQIGG